MAHPLLDFSHLSPAELRRRRAELAADDGPGEPWEQLLGEIEERGA